MTTLAQKIEKGCVFLFIILTACAIFLSLNIWLLSSNMPHYSQFDKHRLLELALFAVTTLWLILSPIRQQRCLDVIASWPRWVWVFAFTFFLLGVSSAAYSQKPAFAFMQVSLYLEMGLLALILASLRQQAERHFDEIAVSVLLVSWVIYCLVDLYLLSAVSFQIGVTQKQTQDILQLVTHPFFDQIRFFTQVLTISLPFAVFPLLNKKLKLWMRIPCWLFLIFMWCLYCGQQSRATVLVAVVVTIYMLIVFRKESLGFLWRHAVALIIAAVLTFVYLHAGMGVSVRPLLSWHNIGRFDIWQNVLTLIQQHPWLGVGPLNYNLSTQIGQLSHPDNTVLLIAAEWGIPAAILMVVLVLWALFKQSSVARHSENRAVALVLTASFVAAVTHSLVSDLILFPVSQMLLVLIAGWMLGHGRVQQQSHTMALRLTLILVALASLAGVVYGVYPYLLQLPKLEAVAVQTCQCSLSPTFWTLGHIAAF